MRIGAKSARRGAVLPPLSGLDLAFLFLVLVVVGGVFSAARGIALDLSDGTPADDLPAPDTPAVWVEVRADGSLLLDGSPVPRDLGAEAIRARLSPYPEAVIVLHAEPQATYASLVGLLTEIAEERPGAVPTERRISIPTRKEVEAYVRATGKNPFEAVR